MGPSGAAAVTVGLWVLAAVAPRDRCVSDARTPASRALAAGDTRPCPEGLASQRPAGAPWASRRRMLATRPSGPPAPQADTTFASVTKGGPSRRTRLASGLSAQDARPPRPGPGHAQGAPTAAPRGPARRRLSALPLCPGRTGRRAGGGGRAPAPSARGGAPSPAARPAAPWPRAVPRGPARGSAGWRGPRGRPGRAEPLAGPRAEPRRHPDPAALAAGRRDAAARVGGARTRPLPRPHSLGPSRPQRGPRPRSVRGAWAVGTPSASPRFPRIRPVVCGREGLGRSRRDARSLLRPWGGGWRGAPGAEGTQSRGAPRPPSPSASCACARGTRGCGAARTWPRTRAAPGASAARRAEGAAPRGPRVRRVPRPLPGPARARPTQGRFRATRGPKASGGRDSQEEA